MKKLILLTLSCIPLLAYSQISGNVFWKYNDVLGNRPDAGSDVVLIPVKDTSLKSAKTDSRGDFNFYGLSSGKYLVMVVSKTVRKNPRENLTQILRHMPLLSSTGVFIFDGFVERINTFKELDSIGNDLAREYFTSKLLTDGKFSKKEIKKKEEAYKEAQLKLDNFAQKLLGDIIVNNTVNFINKNISIIATQYSGLIITEVNYDGNKSNIVVDFGITYI